MQTWDINRNPDGSRPKNRVSVFDLIRDMELSYADAVYWRRRCSWYATAMLNDQNDRLDNELPPRNGIPDKSGDDPTGGGDSS